MWIGIKLKIERKESYNRKLEEGNRENLI